MSKPKPMPSYWALAEEVTHLHGQLDQLKAENAKLRKAVEYLYGFAKTCGVDANDLRELGVIQ